MKGKLSTILLIAATIGLLYIGTHASTTTSPFESATSQASSPDNGSPIGEAAAFTATTLNGGSINLADYLGKRPVILNFWATWCPNCIRDMPNLDQLSREFGDQVTVVAVNLREDPATVRRYIEDNGFSLTVALDPDSSIAQAYGVRYTNYHVVINASGQIVNAFSGDIARRHFLQLLEEN